MKYKWSISFVGEYQQNTPCLAIVYANTLNEAQKKIRQATEGHYKDGIYFKDYTFEEMEGAE